MAGAEPSTQAPSSPTGGRGILAEAVGNMWSALVLGLLAAIFAWFWFGGSDDNDHPGEAEPCTEPVESAERVGGQQQEATPAESVPVCAEAESAEHLLKTDEISVCQAKTNYEIDQLDMGKKEKRDLCYENQNPICSNTSTETSVTYPLDYELEVFPPAEVASDSHQRVLDSLTIDATQCDAPEALLVAIPTAEGTQSNVQATVLDNVVLQSDQDVLDTFARSEGTESSTPDTMLEKNAVQRTMPDAVIGDLNTPEKSMVYNDVSEVSPAAPLLLHEAVMNAYMSAEDAQYILQKDEPAVEAEQFNGPKHELGTEAARAALQENVPAIKATYSVVQSERLGAEAEHIIVMENGLTKEATCNAHKLPPEEPHTILQEDLQDDVAGHVVVHEDGLDAEVSHTAIQEGGLDAGTKRTTAHKDMLDSETPYCTVQENGPDAEAAATTVHKCELDASETRTTLGESVRDVDAAHVNVQENGLVAEAAQASVGDAVLDSSPVKAIQNICTARKEQELLVHTISQKLGYINGHEVIDHFTGGHESRTEELQTDSYVTKELDRFVNSLHVGNENRDPVYMSEPQPKNNDSDSKMRKIAAVTPMPQYVIVKFRVHYITHSESQLIAVTGNHESLGEWNIYVPLKPDKDGFWSDFVLLPVDSSIEWKFVMVENGKIKRWEECNNRCLKTGHDDTEAHQWWGYH